MIGSFLNVCITRIPEDLSIVSPGSRCPRCKTAIKFYDNVPVFAWMWLKGKCRSCGEPISVMYPLVELATGLLFVAAFLEYGITQATVKWLFFTCLIIVLTITDLRVRLLPDLVTWPGFAAGLALSAFVPPSGGFGQALSWQLLHQHLQPKAAGLAEAILGAAFGGFVLWGLAAGYKFILKHDGMGMGDVKMMAMVGAFVGFRGTFLTLLFGSLLGSAIGVILLLAQLATIWESPLARRARQRGLRMDLGLRYRIARKYGLPFGTFLGIGALGIVYLLPLVEHLIELRFPALRGIFG
ncbi:MAG TPA: prepilin peptidase [Candidatus Acidoferrum sp.]|nr:prepilin peptidase [Candidatus Acidoferrum sp.]